MRNTNSGRNPYGPLKVKQGTAAIDNLRVYDPLPEDAKGTKPTEDDDDLLENAVDLLASALAELEHADDEDETGVKDEAKGKRKAGGSDTPGGGKKPSTLGKIGKAAGKIGDAKTALDLAVKASKKLQAKKVVDSLTAKGDTTSPKAKEAQAKLDKAHEELREAVLNTLLEKAADAISAEGMIFLNALKVGQQYFEKDPNFVREEIRNIDEELKRATNPRRIAALIREKERLYKKLQARNRK